jgi:DNA-binding Xre family transcriptional regulator
MWLNIHGLVEPRSLGLQMCQAININTDTINMLCEFFEFQPWELLQRVDQPTEKMRITA